MSGLSRIICCQMDSAFKQQVEVTDSCTHGANLQFSRWGLWRLSVTPAAVAGGQKGEALVVQQNYQSQRPSGMTGALRGRKLPAVAEMQRPPATVIVIFECSWPRTSEVAVAHCRLAEE